MGKLDSLVTAAALAAFAAAPAAAAGADPGAGAPQPPQISQSLDTPTEADSALTQKADARTPGPAARMDDGELEGAAIVSIHGERIGEIERIETDADGQRMAVIGVGGFMGLGETQVKVPLDELEIVGENTFRIRMSVDQLKERASTKG